MRLAMIVFEFDDRDFILLVESKDFSAAKFVAVDFSYFRLFMGRGIAHYCCTWHVYGLLLVPKFGLFPRAHPFAIEVCWGALILWERGFFAQYVFVL